MEPILENIGTRVHRAEAERRRATALIRNAHGVAEWKLFLKE
jgi:hypothetical protein